MADWESTLTRLRQQFVAGSPERLERIESGLSRLGSNPGDPEALADTRLAFHGFSGAGSTYGFPEVTAIGLDAERRCDALRGAEGNPGGAELGALGDLLERLRLALAAAPEGATADSDPGVAAAPSITDILVVDDDAAVLEVLRLRLEGEGMSVRLAACVADAMREIDRRVPDAALVDIGLPDGTGYSVVEHLRSVAGGDAAAVLIVSGESELEDRVEAIHCGADGYFSKPFEPDALLRRLQFLIDRTRKVPARVLVVEDDPDQGAFVTALLESVGHEVRVCRDPKAFAADVASFRPNLVLMDVNLPGTSGYDLARLLRQDDSNPTLAVVFLTTRSDLAARIETARSGGDDHLVKPVSPGLLLSTVAARLERGRFLQGLLELDGLTRLLSHTAFLERVKESSARLARALGRGAAFVMIDLDHFKSVNDRYGHPVGDRVLVALAATLRRHLRQSDTIGRLGGEEFGVLLENISRDETLRLVQRLLEDFSGVEHARPGNGSFLVTFSAGIAVFDPLVDWKAWLAAADAALYRSKTAGRNQVTAA